MPFGNPLQTFFAPKKLPKLVIAYISQLSHLDEFYQKLKEKLKQNFPHLPLAEVRLNAAELAIETVFHEIATYPMFESLRLIFIRNCQYLLSELEKKEKQFPKAHIIESFKKVLKNFPDSTYIVFHFSEKKISEKFSFLLQDASIYEEKELKERDLPLFILEKAKSLGYEISLDAAEAIVKQAAYLPNKAIRALEQLFLFKIKDKKISVDDVYELLDSSSGELRWKIIDALAQRDIPQAVEYFNQSYSEEGILTLGLWFRLFSDFSRYLLLLKSGLSSNEIADILGFKNPQALERLRRMEKNYKPEELEKIFHSFSFFDNQLRLDTSPSRSQILLTNFLLSLSR